MATLSYHELAMRLADAEATLSALRSGQVDSIIGDNDVLLVRALAAEQALHDSEERFRAAFEHAAIGKAIADPEGRFVRVNRSFARMLGYTAPELLLLKWMDVVHPDFLADGRKHIRHLLTGEIPSFEAEWMLVRKDEQTMWVQLNVAVVKSAAGIPQFMVGDFVDITERKQLEAEKETLTAQFYQAQKMESIGKLAGGIAHDFNNLLVPIIGYAEMALARLPKSDPLATNLRHIRDAANRAARLTRQILAFSRRQVLEMRVLNLNDVVSGFEDMLRPLIGEDIAVKIRLADNLPPVEIDESKIEQVLLNLAVNARDAMPKGGELVVETSAVTLDETFVAQHPGGQTGAYVMLAVSDTGVGMDTETKQRIFEPFFTTKKRGEGTGLGLATVFGIVKQHGGNIWVDSENGQGTTVRIYFPVVDEPLSRETSTTAGAQSFYGSETILVVEDQSDVRMLVVETLRAYGYHVLDAGNPLQALVLADEHSGRIHLLLTDVVMPQMGGVEMYKKLVPAHHDMQVLFMSGYTDDIVDKRGALPVGATFLQKPFTIEGLLKKVREALSE